MTKVNGEKAEADLVNSFRFFAMRTTADTSCLSTRRRKIRSRASQVQGGG